MTIPTKTWNAVTIRNGAKQLVSGPRVTTGREFKKIGVEIEFFGANGYSVISALQAAGLRVKEGISYGHSVMSQWKIVTDSSVNSQGTGLSDGLELVSPPLRIADMEVQLKIVMDVLKRMGARVDHTCGLHVHHEIDDLDIVAVKNVFKIYQKHTDTIDTLLLSGRRAHGSDNNYCKSVATVMNGVDSATTIEQLANWYDDYYDRRYNAINMISYLKYGTMEFRQHNGSINYDEVMNWILITQAMISAGVKKAVRAGKTDVVTFERDLNMIGSEQSAYVVSRRKEMKRVGA